jgi:hypothetical protein
MQFLLLVFSIPTHLWNQNQRTLRVANAQVVERVENVSFYRAYLMPIRR